MNVDSDGGGGFFYWFFFIDKINLYFAEFFISIILIDFNLCLCLFNVKFMIFKHRLLNAFM